MKNWIKISITSVILIYLTIRYISTPFLMVDFPCVYDLENNRLETQCIEPDSIKDLIIFISDFPEHASGGSCFCKSIANEEVYEYEMLKISVVGKDILIDDKILNLGDSIEVNSPYLDYNNLWWIYDRQIKLKNIGPIYSFQDGENLRKFEHERQFIAGFDSRQERLNYWTVALFISLSVYLIILIAKVIRNKAHTAKLINHTKIKCEQWAYTSFKQLFYDEDFETNEQVIDFIIRDKYFIWKGEEFPDGETWNWQDKDGNSHSYFNVKMHGHYNSDLLTHTDFNKTTAHSMLEQLNEFIIQNTNDFSYKDQVNSALQNVIDNYDEFYVLKDHKNLKDKESKFNIYSFFKSALAINKRSKKVLLIEFGQD